ncbi:hypothetical protein Bbelb_336770 [Branchiostoma belcheri]|nr:hypothetical protein Bbelb_336770 [Branchiostoma belcheri]
MDILGVFLVIKELLLMPLRRRRACGIRAVKTYSMPDASSWSPSKLRQTWEGTPQHVICQTYAGSWKSGIGGPECTGMNERQANSKPGVLSDMVIVLEMATYRGLRGYIGFQYLHH